MKRQRKVPSFAGLKPASPLCSRIKKANTSCNTRHEVALRNELSQLGLQFRLSKLISQFFVMVTFGTDEIGVYCEEIWRGERTQRIGVQKSPEILSEIERSQAC